MNSPWLEQYDPQVPNHLSYPQIPLFGFLEESSEHFPEQECTIFNNLSITYQKMEQLSNQLAQGLMREGIKKGDRVGLCMPNIPQFVLAFYGVLKAGGVVVALNPMYKQGEMSFQIADSGVKVVLCYKDALPVLRQVEESGVMHQRFVTWVEDADYLSVNSVGQIKDQNEELLPGERTFLSLLCIGAEFLSPRRIIQPDDPAVFQYSGGTTGTPKGAIGLHRNLVANTLQFKIWLSEMKDGQETILTAIPLYHVYGMVIAMSMGIALGARLVLTTDPRNILELLRLIEQYRPTIFPGVPGLYHGINQHPDVQAGRYDLSSIKACISGSAPLLREVKEKFEALTGGKLVEGYGLSEAPTATHCNPIQGENRTGSIGLPLPDVEARIVDLESGDRDLSTGEPGELIIRGPQIMFGYHNRPNENKVAIRNGWLFTGDVARMDEDGYFYLVDRKKEVIKASGFQVWPREVEEVIAGHPAVLEAGVAGVMRPGRGETVKAWIVLKPGYECSPEEIQIFCDERLVSYKVPAEIEFVVKLPRTNVGKLLRRELVRMDQELAE